LLPHGKRRVISIHNFCPVPPEHKCSWGDDYLLSSPEEAKRTLGVQSTLQTIEWAKRLGASVVVMHLGEVEVDKAIFKTIKQSVANGSADQHALAMLVAVARKERDRRAPRHLDAARKSLDDILAQLPSGIILGLECRSDYYQIPNVSEAQQLLAEYGDAVGYWHDVGHAHMQEIMGFYKPDEYIRTLHDRLIGWHIHDSLRVSDHRAPGDGEIDFNASVKPYLKDDALKVLEFHPRMTRTEAARGIELLQAMNIIP
jgi:sugar phosphate isomerase/epimerase